MITVALADDHAMVRAGFRLVLDAQAGITVVGEAGDGEQIVALARRVRPDIVLMDVQMPRCDGLRATEILVADPAIGCRIIVVTTFERDDYIFEALRVGASGFILKNSPPEELVHAVRIVADGDALLAPSVTRRVIEHHAGRPVARADAAPLQRLTPRETQVLRLIAAGCNNAEIAAELHVGEGTAKTHVSHILAKLALRDRVHAVVYAYQSGLVG